MDGLIFSPEEIAQVRSRLRHERLIADLAELQAERDRFYGALVAIAVYQHGDSERQQGVARKALA